MVKDRLARHLTALLIAKIIVLVAIWAAFFRAPPGAMPLDPAAHVFAAAPMTPPAHSDRP